MPPGNRYGHGQPGSRIPDDVRDAIVEAAKQPGATRNGIAKQFGVGAASVSGICDRAGVTFDRASVKAATDAKRADAQLRLQTILDRELAEWERQLSIVEGNATYKTKMRGASASEKVVTLDFIPADDLRQLTAARSSSRSIVLELQARDTAAGVDGTRSILAQLGRELGITE